MMKTKQLMVAAAVLLLFPAGAGADTGKREKLKIHLPREITVESGTPTLGEAAILRGDPDLVAKAKTITLGKISTPQQQIVLSKTVLLSRLACSGIPAHRVALTGAEEIQIQLQHQRITGSQLAEQAAAFLKKHPPEPTVCDVENLRIPDDLILPGIQDNIDMSCRLIAGTAAHSCRVEVIVTENAREIGRAEIPFGLKYRCRRAVTTRPVARGETLSKQNVAVEDGISDRPEPAGWAAPYGLIAVRALPADAVLTNAMAAAPRPEVVIKRNQTVSIKIDTAGLLATAFGKALQDGVTGEYIKVQNVDSKIVLMAKVNEDGTVEPVF